MRRRLTVSARAATLAMMAVGLSGAALATPAATIVLPGDRVFPESTTATADGTIYVGSLASGGIMRIPKGATKAEPFIAPGANDSRSIFGVLADETSGTLWACSNDASALGVPGPSQVKGSALKGFDLKTGASKISVPLPGAKTLCNDIAIGPDGAAYVTNSLAPDILKLAPGAKTFTVWVSNPMFEPPEKGAGLDGIAFAPDGTAYVDTFDTAELFRISGMGDRMTLVQRITPSQPLVLADALRPTDGGKAFLLIEGAGRLDRVTFSGVEAKVTTLRDGLAGPTGVAEVDGTAWVSEGQLPYLFGSKQGQPTLPFDLRGVPLSH